MIESLERVQTILLNKIKPSPFNSRKVFDEDKIKELADSIRQEGLINPITVRPENNYFEIVCGERRFRAYRMINLSCIDAFVKNWDDNKVMLAQLAENIQREDLNYLEEAQGLKNVMDKAKYSTYDLARYINKSQTWVVNRLSFLDLREDFKTYLLNGKLGPGQIKTIAQLIGNDKFLDIIKERIEKEDITVRDLWQLVHTLVDDEAEKKGIKPRLKNRRNLIRSRKTFEQIVKIIKQKTNNREIHSDLNILLQMYEEVKKNAT